MALANGWQFQTLVYERDAELSKWAQQVITRAAADRFEVATELFRGLSGKNGPSELLGVVKMPDRGLERIPIKPDLLVAVVDRPGNPGNLGTLIRSCDAFGAHGVIVTGHGVDIYDTATITASRGSLFAIPVVRVESHEDVTRWLAGIRRELGSCRVVGTDEAGAIEVSDYNLVSPIVVLLGNETQGLSHAYQQLCDAIVRIPMIGSATSLNVSVAASIVLYDVLRQRRLHTRRVVISNSTATAESHLPGHRGR
jgi:TrmH family RNA methyltransferase